MENTRIVSLEASNVLRLTAVRITPDRNVVEIRGANAAGKSSVIDSIVMALGGKTLCPDVPVHRGAEQGQVVLELENLVITRKCKGENTSLTVANRDGAVFKSPQTLLSELWNTMTFDPLGFLRKTRQEQLAVLLAVQGLTERMAESVANEKLAMDGRKEVAASVRRLNVQVTGIDVLDDTPDAEVDVVALAEELRIAEGKINANDAHAIEADRMGGQIEETKLAIASEQGSLVEAEEELERMIERARGRMAQIREAIAGNQLMLENLRQEHEGREAAVNAFIKPETADIEDRLASANAVNAAVGRLKERTQLEIDLKAANLVLADADTAVSNIRLARTAMLVGVELPVPGLGFNDDGVTLDDLPFDQASSAHQLRVSVAMAMKMNPTLRVLLIRDGSLLDRVQLAALYEQIRDTDYQLWIERVGTDGEMSEVVIEDGHIAGSTDVACSACSKIIPRAEAEANLIGGEGPVHPVRCIDCYANALQVMGDRAEEDQAAAEADRANAAAQEDVYIEGTAADLVDPDLADGPPVER